MLSLARRRQRTLVLAILLVSLLAMSLTVLTEAGPASGKVKAPADVIEVIIVESNSDFFNVISKVSPGPLVLIGVDDATGTCVDDIIVQRNKEVVFQIEVNFPAGSPTGDVWQTGPPSRNPDRARHALITNLAPDTTLVEFEDKTAPWTDPDEPNYVDARFVVRPDTNCSAPLPPIPPLP